MFFQCLSYLCTLHSVLHAPYPIPYDACYVVDTICYVIYAACYVLRTLSYMPLSNIRDAMWIKELEQHPEYATLKSHPHYTSFQDAILYSTTKEAKENIYKFYCDD